MADNTLINQATDPGQYIATEEIGGVNHELVKLEFGVDGVATKVSALDPLPVTGTVTIDTTGLATSANQDTEIAFLASIEGKTVAVNTGAVVVASSALPTGAAIAANQQTDALTNTQLRATPVPISGTVTVDTSLLATAANQATEITALGTLLTTTDFDSKTGSLTETAPATDTASSGLNGRLQRIAQRITSLIAALGSPFQAGGSIGNTSFIATQSTATNLKTQAESYQGGSAVGSGNPLQVTGANGSFPTTEVVPTTIFNGKTTVTVAGTRVVLAASQAVKSVTIKALSINTGFIYVGNATVASTNGLQLLAGDSISMDIANLNTVNIDSSINGEGVSYFAVN